MISPSHHAASEREHARRRNGQFGVQARDEADLDLGPATMTPDAPASAARATAPDGWVGSEKIRQQIVARLEELQEFVGTHQRLPQRRAQDPQEKGLADWAYRHTRTPRPWPAVMEVIASAGGYTGTAGAPAAVERPAELEAFIARHGRLPRPGSRSVPERSLGQWARRQVTTHQNPDAKSVALIEQHGGYPEPLPPGSAHAERARRDRSAELSDFIAEHDRLPSVGRSTYESTLYDWFKRNMREGTLSPEIVALIEQYRDRSKRTRDRVEQFRKFVEEHGRAPSLRGPGEESGLREWARDHRNTKDADPVVVAWLERHEQGSLEAMEAARLGLIQELEAFIAAHGRYPRPTRLRHAENKLYQRAHYYLNKKTPDAEVQRIALEHGVSAQGNVTGAIRPSRRDQP